MNKGKTCAPRMTVARPGHRAGIPAAALAALLLAGCSSGHVGDDWQCPLATGGSCASVAAADPAVPKTDAMPTRTPGQAIRLLPREWGAGRTDGTAASPAREPAPDPIRGPGQAPAAARSCETDCGFDPFGWLAQLLRGSDHGDRPNGEDTEPVTVDSAAMAVTPTSRSAASGAAPLPADSATSGHDDLQPDDLRTGETVARIWIAPFVDADGVYREASHVRVVLEPAGWRLK